MSEPEHSRIPQVVGVTDSPATAQRGCSKDPRCWTFPSRLSDGEIRGLLVKGASSNNAQLTSLILQRLLMALAVCLASLLSAELEAQGTGFTYQGLLKDNGALANGI